MAERSILRDTLRIFPGVLASFTLVLLSAPGPLQAEDITLDQVPASVTQAVTAQFPGIIFTEAEVEVEDDIMIYQLEGEVDGREYEIEVDSEGNILDIEED